MTPSDEAGLAYPEGRTKIKPNLPRDVIIIVDGDTPGNNLGGNPLKRVTPQTPLLNFMKVESAPPAASGRRRGFIL